MADHFVKILIRLHEGSKIIVKFDDKDVEDRWTAPSGYGRVHARAQCIFFA